MTRCVFRGYGVRIGELEREAFLKVRETLTRVGISGGENVIVQPVYILHKRGEYALLHFRELQALDGMDASPTAEDLGVRNTVAYLLDQWGLVDLEDPRAVSQPRCTDGSLIVVPYKEKKNYVLRPSYQIGKVK